MRNIGRVALTVVLFAAAFAMVDALSVFVPGTTSNRVSQLATAIGGRKPTAAEASMLMYLTAGVDWFGVAVPACFSGAVAGLALAALRPNRRTVLWTGTMLVMLCLLILIEYESSPLVPSLIGGAISAIGFSWGSLVGRRETVSAEGATG